MSVPVYVDNNHLRLPFACDFSGQRLYSVVGLNTYELFIEGSYVAGSDGDYFADELNNACSDYGVF